MPVELTEQQQRLGALWQDLDVLSRYQDLSDARISLSQFRSMTELSQSPVQYVLGQMNLSKKGSTFELTAGEARDAVSYLAAWQGDPTPLYDSLKKTLAFVESPDVKLGFRQADWGRWALEKRREEAFSQLAIFLAHLPAGYHYPLDWVAANLGVKFQELVKLYPDRDVLSLREVVDLVEGKTQIPLNSWDLGWEDYQKQRIDVNARINRFETMNVFRAASILNIPSQKLGLWATLLGWSKFQTNFKENWLFADKHLRVLLRVVYEYPVDDPQTDRIRDVLQKFPEERLLLGDIPTGEDVLEKLKTPDWAVQGYTAHQVARMTKDSPERVEAGMRALKAKPSACGKFDTYRAWDVASYIKNPPKTLKEIKQETPEASIDRFVGYDATNKTHREIAKRVEAAKKLLGELKPGRKYKAQYIASMLGCSKSAVDNWLKILDHVPAFSGELSYEEAKDVVLFQFYIRPDQLLYQAKVDLRKEHPIVGVDMSLRLIRPEAVKWALKMTKGEGKEVIRLLETTEAGKVRIDMYAAAVLFGMGSYDFLTFMQTKGLYNFGLDKTAFLRQRRSEWEQSLTFDTIKVAAGFKEATDVEVEQPSKTFTQTILDQYPARVLSPEEAESLMRDLAGACYRRTPWQRAARAYKKRSEWFKGKVRVDVFVLSDALMMERDTVESVLHKLQHAGIISGSVYEKIDGEGLTEDEVLHFLNVYRLLPTNENVRKQNVVASTVQVYSQLLARGVDVSAHWGELAAPYEEEERKEGPDQIQTMLGKLARGQDNYSLSDVVRAFGLPPEQARIVLMRMGYRFSGRSNQVVISAKTARALAEVIAIHRFREPWIETVDRWMLQVKNAREDQDREATPDQIQAELEALKRREKQLEAVLEGKRS